MLINIGTILGVGLVVTVVYLLVEDLVRRHKK